MQNASGNERPMTSEGKDYLLAGGVAELERLRLQARVWEPEAEIMLDHIGVARGWRCIDLGCGAMGVLGPLSRRVGPEGRVVGVDLDAKQLAAARAYISQTGLNNVDVLELDAYNTGFPRESFDLVHVRFLFAPSGHDAALLRELLTLTRPGGIVAIQEPDASSWNCYPTHPSWKKLKEIILAVFSAGGGDFYAGTRTYGMLRQAGLHDVRIRAAITSLQSEHPYMRLPVQFATSLKKRIIDSRVSTEAELERLMADCERIAKNPETFVLSFVVTQVWGRKGA